MMRPMITDHFLVPDRVAIVTGAGRGIGAATARTLAEAGADVVISARTEAQLREVADDVEALGRRAVCVPADLSDLDELPRLVQAAVDEFGRLDIVVNNAGVITRGPVSETSDADWSLSVGVNVEAPFRICRSAIPILAAAGGGAIVNIASVAGTYPYPGGNVYGASKAFVRHFSYGLLADLIATPVRCTLIEPGLVGGSEFSNVRFKGDSERAASIYADTDPLTPEDIAEAVGWTVQQPARVNVSLVQVLPTCQGPGPVAVHKTAPKPAK